MISKVKKGIRNPRLAVEKLLSIFIPNKYAFRISDVGRHRDLDHYNIPIDPFEIYWIDPSHIKRHTGRKYPFWENKRNLIGKVEDGDWDRRLPRGGNYPLKFEDRTYYKAAEELFRNNMSLNNEQFWNDKFPQKSLDKIKHHVGRINEISKTIKENGYQTQSELGEHPRDKRYRHFDEITVDIARDGEFLFVNSSHRLTAAKLMDLEKVPVTVCVRHKQWVDKLVNQQNPLPETHPDVHQLYR